MISRWRVRPTTSGVAVTAFGRAVVFIPGPVPLMFGQGTAAISRRDVGTPVSAGMIAASGAGIFVIPMLYVAVQRLRKWGCRKADRPGRGEDGRVEGGPPHHPGADGRLP